MVFAFLVTHTSLLKLLINPEINNGDIIVTIYLVLSMFCPTDEESETQERLISNSVLMIS